MYFTRVIGPMLLLNVVMAMEFTLPNWNQGSAEESKMARNLMCTLFCTMHPSYGEREESGLYVDKSSTCECSGTKSESESWETVSSWLKMSNTRTMNCMIRFGFMTGRPAFNAAYINVDMEEKCVNPTDIRPHKMTIRNYDAADTMVNEEKCIKACKESSKNLQKAIHFETPNAEHKKYVCDCYEIDEAKTEFKPYKNFIEKYRYGGMHIN